ncbi:hypothetical protein GYA49_03720 [Candidatus Beckwithbacteria bacterium]|nr:hypothetical protein [Candidatus Beckwithbacteria bacterium]
MPKTEKKSNFIKKALGEKKLSLKERSSPLMVLAIIGLTAILFMFPSFKKIYETREVLAEKEVTLKNMKQKNSILQNLEQNDQKANFEQKFKTAETFLPSQKPSLQVLINLTNLARQEKVQFSGLTLNPGVVKDPEESEGSTKQFQRADAAPKKAEQDLSNFEITFTILGTKTRLQNFIAKLKEVAPMMKIEEFSTAVDDQNTSYKSANLMSADFKVRVFYQKLPETLPSYSTKLTTFTQEEEEVVQKLSDFLDRGGDYSQDVMVVTEDLGNSNPFAAHQEE